jgi:hypothetical protein
MQLNGTRAAGEGLQLANVINFPVVYTVVALPALLSLATVAAAAVVIVAIAGYLASVYPRRSPARRG